MSAVAPAPALVVGEQVEVVDRIDRPGLQLAVWHRPAAARQAEQLRCLHPGPMRLTATLDCRTGRLLARVPDPDDGWTLAPSLQAAIHEVLRGFARIASVRGLDTLSVRLETIESRVCKRFHVDHVGLRLLCTLYGAGTEWIPEYAADRSQLGAGGGAVLREADAVRQIPAGDIAVLKGHCHRGDPGLGLIHRSPEATPAAPRLLLAADLPA